MPSIEDIVAAMQRNPADVRFQELRRVCEHYFGPARRSSGSHLAYKTPWIGNPRVNIQDEHGKAKAYQVRQVLKAVERMEKEYGLGE